MKKYLLNEADRRELARLISKERSGPPRPLIPESQKIVVEEGDSYWALPPCETGIPAAEMIEGKLHTVGIQCCLFRHAWGEDEMEALLDPVGNPIRVTVWNYYERRENGLIQVYKHKDGTWTNERPEVVVSGTSTLPPEGTTTPPIKPDPLCQGECLWQANGDGVWGWPTGGCANATTTTTTTTSTTTGTTTTSSPAKPGSTRYPEPPPATLAPCTATKCTLVCVDTSTTPAPTEFGVIVPYNRFRYQLADGSVCPTGCTCYGLGDPCFLVEGELVSSCIGSGPTTTSTTTPNPDAAPCVQAEFIFGTVPPQVYRAATANNGATDWQTCGNCAPGTEPLYPLGGEVYRRHDWRNLGTVYETPCVEGPCGLSPAPTQGGNAVFVAWPWQTQVDKWGYTTGATFYDRLSSKKKFLANWFYCRKCSGNFRPDLPPPVWIYEDEATNIRNGVFFDPDTNTYTFESKCISGYACDTCGRAPTRRVWEYQGPPTSAAPTTTGSPTTTGGPTSTTSTSTTTSGPNCGCIRPSFCPRPFECFRGPCERGGEVVNGTPNPATTVVPPSPCFPDRTTTGNPATTTTASPGTTSWPFQCYDSYGNLCNCGGNGPGTTIRPPNTTSLPCGGTCAPGQTLVQLGDKCSPPVCADIPPPPPPTLPPPPPGCGGGCLWEALPAPGCNDPPPVWVLVSNSCFGGFNCSCDAPGVPGACGALRFTGCVERQPPQPPVSTTPRPPCSCCSTTPRPDPCVTGVCRYRSNSSNGWTLVSNSCRTACPCPDPGGLPPPGNTCSSFNLPCGYVLPPTSSPPTTSGTTTTGNPNGCCSNALYPGTCYNSDRNSCIASGGSHFAGSACTRLADGNFYCRPTTTDPPGCCRYNFRANSGYISCASFTRTYCSQIGGIFTANGTCVNVDTRPGFFSYECREATTTTQSPIYGACCFLLAGGYSCMEASTAETCRNLQGSFFGNVPCAATPCPVSTSTSTTTTTTTCPCPYTDCGCTGALGASPSCAPGWIWDCSVCGCVAVTTTPSPTTTTTTNSPMGRCCVGSACSVTNELVCMLDGGVWTAGLDCSGFSPCGPL